MAEHELARGKVHVRWNNALEPALRIRPGDMVHCWAEEVSNGEITRDSTVEDLTKPSFAFHYPLAGPIHRLRRHQREPGLRQ